VPPDETPESMTSTATTTTRYKASLMLNPKMVSTLKIIEFGRSPETGMKSSLRFFVRPE